MSSLLGRRAVVVGAGIGGLSMAGALARHFEPVEVLERDHLTACAASRCGTPQDRHPHGLLAGGLKALGEIFPGFERDLANAGAVPVYGRARDPIRAGGCRRAAATRFRPVVIVCVETADRAGAATSG